MIKEFGRAIPVGTFLYSEDTAFPKLTALGSDLSSYTVMTSSPILGPALGAQPQLPPIELDLYDKKDAFFGNTVEFRTGDNEFVKESSIVLKPLASIEAQKVISRALLDPTVGTATRSENATAFYTNLPIVEFKGRKSGVVFSVPNHHMIERVGNRTISYNGTLRKGSDFALNPILQISNRDFIDGKVELEQMDYHEAGFSIELPEELSMLTQELNGRVLVVSFSIVNFDSGKIQDILIEAARSNLLTEKLLRRIANVTIDVFELLEEESNVSDGNFEPA